MFSRANRCRASRDAHMATCWFCGFGLEHAVPYTQFLNLAHWMQMSHDGGMVTVHHICQFSSSLTWIIVDYVLNDLHQTPKVFLNVECHLCQNDPPQNKKTIFLLCSLWWHCPHTWYKCFWLGLLLVPLCWTQREEYVGNVPISPFSSVHSSTHYLQMTKLQYVNSSTTIELQIKNGNQ